MSGPRDGTGDAPADDQQRDENDQKDVLQRAQEGLTPNPQALLPDISGVMNDRQSTEEIVPPVQGPSVDVDRGAAYTDESARVVIFAEGLQYDRGRARHQRHNAGRDLDRLALRVVDRQSRQMIPVGILLDGVLEVVLRIPLKIALHVSGKTLAQHLCAVLQIFLQPPVEHHYLVVRRAQRYQRYANNERDDQSGA